MQPRLSLSVSFSPCYPLPHVHHDVTLAFNLPVFFVCVYNTSTLFVYIQYIYILYIYIRIYIYFIFYTYSTSVFTPTVSTPSGLSNDLGTSASSNILSNFALCTGRTPSPLVTRCIYFFASLAIRTLLPYVDGKKRRKTNPCPLSLNVRANKGALKKFRQTSALFLRDPLYLSLSLSLPLSLTSTFWSAFATCAIFSFSFSSFFAFLTFYYRLPYVNA